MTGGFAAVPDQLQAAAPQYDAISVRLRQIYGDLTDALATAGDCWGNDEPGRAFAAKYVPTALSTVQQMDLANEGLQSLVDGVCAWARNYVNADAAAQADAAQLAQPEG